MNLNSILMKIVLLSFFAFSQLAWAEKVSIAFTQAPENKSIQELSQKLAEELSKKTKLTVEAVVLKDYISAEALMRENKVQFSFLNPATFVKLEQEGLLKVLLKKVWEGPFYYSTVLVPTASKFKKLKDLKGKKITFVDRKSTSGYLAPLVGFKKAKLKFSDFAEVNFSGSHSASVEMLKNNKTDAIAVFSDGAAGDKNAWQKYSAEPANKVRSIWVSEPISNDPFVVSKKYFDTNQAQVLALMLALMEISASPGHELYSELIGDQALMPATSQHYESVKELMNMDLN